MKNLFIPYELARIAKEKNFNEPCIAFYNDYRECHLNQTYHLFYLHLKAPLYQQITDWLREKHNIEICLKPNVDIVDSRIIYFNEKEIARCSIDNEKYHKYKSELKKDCYTYHQALDKAIEEAFKLIPQNNE